MSGPVLLLISGHTCSLLKKTIFYLDGTHSSFYNQRCNKNLRYKCRPWPICVKCKLYLWSCSGESWGRPTKQIRFDYIWRLRSLALPFSLVHCESPSARFHKKYLLQNGSTYENMDCCSYARWMCIRREVRMNKKYLVLFRNLNL